MRNRYKLYPWIAVFMIGLWMVGCAHQDGQVSTAPTTTTQTPKARVSPGMMKVSFAYPVVMVNDKRMQRTENETQESIEISYPENSEQNIKLVIITPEGEEKTINGKIKVFQYSQYSRAEGVPVEVIPVAATEADYYGVLRHGYGEFTVKERVERAPKGTVESPTLLKLILGTKAETTGMLEFRLMEDAGIALDSKQTTATWQFAENSKHDFKFTMDEGKIKLNAVLEVYQHTPYTEFAPVWITLDEATKECLRGRGGKAELAFYVPSATTADVPLIKSIGANADPSIIARKEGTMVALMKLKRMY